MSATDLNWSSNIPLWGTFQRITGWSSRKSFTRTLENSIKLMYLTDRTECTSIRGWPGGFWNRWRRQLATWMPLKKWLYAQSGRSRAIYHEGDGWKEGLGAWNGRRQWYPYNVKMKIRLVSSTYPTPFANGFTPKTSDGFVKISSQMCKFHELYCEGKAENEYHSHACLFRHDRCNE